MQAAASPHSLVLLNTRFRPLKQRLLFPHARLFFDRIELRGWQFPDRYTEIIPLAHLCRIEWLATGKSPSAGARPNVIFHLDDGRKIPVILEDVDAWRHTLEQRMSWPQRAMPVA